MTTLYPTERVGGIRRFTIIAWLLWTMLPAISLGGLGWVTDYVGQSAGTTDPADLTLAMAAFFYMSLLLVPVVSTLQWLILRRAWPKLSWAAWLFVVIVSVLGLAVAGPIVMMQTGSAFYGTAPPILIIGLAAAAALSIASPKPFRRSAFAVIFLSVFSGGELSLIMEFNALLLKLPLSINPFTAHPSVVALLKLHTNYFLLHYHHVLSLACGTAVSGLGLWLVSRCACRTSRPLPVADRA